MIITRRRFFGMMAAPAIIGISGRMQLWVPKPALVIKPTKLIVPPHLEEFTTENLRYKAHERYLAPDIDWRFVHGTPGALVTASSAWMMGPDGVVRRIDMGDKR